MAGKTTPLSVSTDPVQPNAPQIPVTPPAANAPAQAPAPRPRGLRDLLGGLVHTSGLSEAAKAYIETMRAGLEASGLRITNLATDYFESVLIEAPSNETAIALIFEETFRRGEFTQDVPPTHPACINILNNKYQAIQSKVRNKCKLFDTILVCPEDYPRAQKMELYLRNTLEKMFSSDITAGFSLLSFVNEVTLLNAKLRVNTDINDIRRFVDSHSPHAHPSRADIGLMLSLSTQNNEVPSYQQRDRNGYVDTPIMAVVGYTDYIEVASSHLTRPVYPGAQRPETMLLPLITITEVVCPVADPGMLMIAMALATKAWHQDGRWLSIYDNVQGPDLGNLMTNSDGTIATAKKLSDRQALIANCFLPPQLAIDSLIGRAQLPGISSLSHLVMSPGVDKNAQLPTPLHNKFNTFLTSAFAMNTTVNPIVGEWPVATGLVNTTGNTWIDSREVDRLSLIKRSVSDMSALAHFTSREDNRVNPLCRLDAIKSLNIGTRSLYAGSNIVFNPLFIANLVECMGRAGFGVEYLQPTTAFIDHVVLNLINNTPALGNVGLDYRQAGPGVTPFGGFAGILQTR